MLSLPIYAMHAKGGGTGMKKPMTPRATAKEAAFWEMIKKGAKDPGTVCSK